MQQHFGYPLVRSIVPNPNSRTPFSSQSQQSEFSEPTRTKNSAGHDFGKKNQGIWSNVRDTFRSRKADDDRYDENNSPKRISLGRRKSLKDLFATVRKPKTHKGFANSVSTASSKQEGAASPSKNFLYFNLQSPALASVTKRRKSLSDILGTITDRLSPNRNWKKSFRGYKDYPDFEVLENAGQYCQDGGQLSENIAAHTLSKIDHLKVCPRNATHQNLTQGYKPSSGLYVSRSASPEPGPKVPIPSALCEGSLRDSFGARSSLDRIAAKYEGRKEGRNNALITNVGQFPQKDIPNEELEPSQRNAKNAFHQSIIDNRTPPLCKNKLEPDGHKEFRWSLSSGEHNDQFLQTTSVKGSYRGLQTANREKVNLRESLTSDHVTQQLEDQMKTLATLTASKYEASSSVNARDIDSNFNYRLEERKEKYQKLGMEYNNLEIAEHEKIATGIRLTLARMTKNIHMSSHAEEDSMLLTKRSSQMPHDALSSDQHQKEFLETVAQGNKILSQIKQSHGTRQHYPFQWSLKQSEFSNQVARKSVTSTEQSKCVLIGGYDSPQSRNDSLKSISANLSPQAKTSSYYTTNFVKPERKSENQSASSATFSGTSPPSDLTSNTKDQKEYNYTDIDSTKTRIKVALGTKSSSQNKHDVNFDPVHVKFPQTPISSFRMEVFANKFEAMTMLCGQNLGDFDSFCTYDPESRIFDLYLPNAALPSHVELQNKGLEVIWLPAQVNDPLLQCSNKYKISPLYHQYMQPFILDAARSTPLKAPELTFTVNSENRGYPTEWSLVSHYPREHQASCKNSADFAKTDPNSQNPSVAVRELGATSEEGNFVFDDDYFLEVDPDIARSYLGSQYNEISSVIHSDSEDSHNLEASKANDPSMQLANVDCNPPRNWIQLGHEYFNSLPLRRSTNGWSAFKDETGIPNMEVDNLLLRLDFDDKNDGTPVARPWKGLGRDYLQSRHLKESRTGTTEGQRFVKACYPEGSDPTPESDQDIVHSSQKTWTEIGEIILELGGVKSFGSKSTAKLEATTHDIKHVLSYKESAHNIMRRHSSSSESPQHIEDSFATNSGNFLNREIADVHNMPPDGFKSEQRRINSYGFDHASSPRNNQPSENSVDPLASGFKFISYDEQPVDNPEEHLATSDEKTRAATTIAVFHNFDHTQAQSLTTSIEPCQISSDADGHLKPVTAHNLNIRFMGKAARQNTPNNLPGKVGALVDIFQFQGLMPQDVGSVLSRPLPPAISPPYKRDSSRWRPSPLQAETPPGMENCSAGIEGIPGMGLSEDLH